MPDYDDDLVEFQCELKNETDKAWIVIIDGDDCVVPKSIGEWAPESNQVDGWITMPTWKAKEFGLA